eukprot:RCo026100
MALVSSDRGAAFVPALMDTASNAGLMIVSARGPPAMNALPSFDPSRLSLGGSALDEAYVFCRHIRNVLGVQKVALLIDDRLPGSGAVSVMSTAASDLQLEIVATAKYRSLNDAISAAGSLSGRGDVPVVIYGEVYVLEILRSFLSSPQTTVYVFSTHLDSGVIARGLQAGNSSTIFFSDFFPLLSSSSTVATSCRSALASYSSTMQTTQAMVEGCLVAQMMQDVVKTVDISTMTPAGLRGSFFTMGSFVYGDTRLGAYTNSSCKKWSTTANCECGQGAHSVVMYNPGPSSSANLKEAAGTTSLSFQTCGVIPSAALSAGSAAFIIGVAAAGGVVGLLALAG